MGGFGLSAKPGMPAFSVRTPPYVGVVTDENGDRMQRQLSFSEIATAMTCQARWDFAYGGRLAGDCLTPKALTPILSEGRAWGSACAAWHSNARTILAEWEAHQALRDSLNADYDAMTEAGLWPPSPQERLATETRLATMLDHYMATAEPLPNLTRLEGEIVTALPSRLGHRRSTRYRFQCYLDGYTTEDGQQWIVEFKLRNQLTEPALLARQRQHRWYAWALGQEQGFHPTGVISDERLNLEPKPARLVQGRRKGEGRVPSHAKDQQTTVEDYLGVCFDHGIPPKPETADALRARVWQQRHPFLFSPLELEQAGRELVSGSKLIRDLDNGDLEPIRNASRMTCGGCRFREVCDNPTDRLLVDSLFDRKPAKRDRLEETDEVRTAA
jgi:hypothetical protein